MTSGLRGHSRREVPAGRPTVSVDYVVFTVAKCASTAASAPPTNPPRGPELGSCERYGIRGKVGSIVGPSDCVHRGKGGDRASIRCPRRHCELFLSVTCTVSFQARACQSLLSSRRLRYPPILHASRGRRGSKTTAARRSRGDRS